MFNKLKSFSEDVAKSFNEIQQGDPVRRNADNIRQLKNGQAILSTNTPESEELVQPEDEPATATSLENREAPEIPVAASGPLKDIDLNQLPGLVRAKLKKFAKYEEKYPVLLDAFKTEKRKGELVIAFEKVLKECTPVSTISDAGLLVDYLTSLNEKASLLDAELRKTVSELTKTNKEKADIAKKLADAEKTMKYAEEAADKAQVQEKSLQDETAQLNEYIKKFETQLEESNSEIERLRAEIEKVTQKPLKEDDELERNESEIQADLSPREDKIADLKKDIEEKVLIIDSLVSQKSQLVNEVKSLNEKIDKTKGDKERIDSERDQLVKNHEKIQQELSLKLEASDKENVSLTQQIEASKRELSEANFNLEKLIKENVDLVKPDSFDLERKEMKSHIIEITETKKQLELQLDTANEQILSLSDNISSIQMLVKEDNQKSKNLIEEKGAQVGELQLTIDNLKQQIADFESGQKLLTDKVKSLECLGAKSVEISESSRKETEEAKQQIVTLESKIAELTQELSLKSEETLSSLPTPVTSSQSTKSKGKKKKNGKPQASQPAPIESIDWESKLELVNGKIVSLEQEKLQLVSDKEKAIKEKEKHFEEKERILKEKETLLAENESLLASIKVAESSSASSHEDAMAENSKLKENLEGLMEERDGLMKTNADLVKAKESSEREKEVLVKAREVLEGEKQKLLEIKDSWEKEKADLFRIKKSLEEEKAVLLEDKLELQTLKDEALVAQSKLEDQRNDLAKSIAELEATTKNSIGDVMLLQNEKESLQAEKDQLEKDVTKSNRDLSSKNEEVETLRDLLKVIGDDLVTAKDQIKELKQASKAESEENFKELQNLNANLQKLIEKKKEEYLKANSKVQLLEEELTTSKELSEKSKKELKDLHAKLASVNSDLQSAKKEILSLTTEKQKLNKRVDELSKFKSADSSLKLEIASMQSSISHKDEQIRELKETIERKNRERDELNDTISTLKATNSDLISSNKSLVSEKSALINKHEMAVERTASLNSELSKLQISRQKVVTELDALKLLHNALLNSKSKSSDDVQAFKQQCEELTMKVKDAQVKIDNLEDDLFEAGNMLQERTRESSTIRKLLIDAEEQTNIKTAELKNEIRSVTEEKNEIESQLHAALKKKQRESEEFKDIAGRHASTIQELEKSIEALNNKYEPLLKVNTVSPEARQKQKDLEEIIAELRLSLSDASKKIKDYENLNSILKKLNDETSLKFERLSKNYKQITQQYRQMQEQKAKQTPSARISEENPRASSTTAVSIPYLKNVLVGFLEHREQRDQLLPVMKTLFEFNEDDERKLISALK